MKSIFKSKTVWLNAVLTVVGVVAFLQTQPLSADTLKSLVILAGVLNIVNRVWFTSEPIA